MTMKKGIKYLLILIIFLTYQSINSAQSPEKFTYQAVVRDATDLLLTNQLIGLQITILNGAVPVYVETFTPTTNTNALVSVEVGTGVVSSGVFADIDWGTGTYFIKADIDPTGGTAYIITGTAELLSVPYALYSKTAENGFSGDFNDLTNKPNFDGSETKLIAGSKVTVTGTGTSATPYMVNAQVPVSGFEHYLGESFMGGIIFYIYKGSDGTEYDLIVHPNESAAALWQNTSTFTNARRTYDGEWNTDLMTDSPAKTYVVGLGQGWYLPSIDELNLLYQNRFHANQGLEGIGGTPFSTVDAATNNYWSSTEFSSTYAWYMSFNTGVVAGTSSSGANPKPNNRRVRAIKKYQPIIGTPYQGGEIAYVFKPNDPGYVEGEMHGLIKAVNDFGNAGWGCTSSLGILSDIGTGAANTADIVANCLTPGIAARVADDYVNPDNGTGVYTDWFLPSVDELGKIGENFHMLGGLGGTLYWSSSGGPGASSTNAWRVEMTGPGASFLPKSGSYRVLPVRYF